MSSYFRTAARCDPTIAAKAPVKIYDIPQPETDSVEELASEGAAVDVNRMRFEERMGIDTLAGTSLIRAQLEHTSMASRRLDEVRDARVLQRESERRARLEARLQEEAARNARLLASIEAERASRLAAEEAAKEEQSRNAAQLAQREHRLSPFKRLQHLQSTAEGNQELEAAIVDKRKIDVFEKIRLEEERRLRHGSSGIIGMYNNIALTKAMELDGGGPGAPKPFPLDFAEGKANPPIDFIPTSVDELLASGFGRERTAEVVQRVKSFESDLDRSLHRVKSAEQKEREGAEEYRRRVERERTLMLAEVVAQDAVRQREKTADRDAVLHLTHPATFADHCGASDVVNGTVLGSRRVERSATAPGCAIVKPHPIDVYQGLVRDDLYRERAEALSERERAIMERV